MVRVTCLGAAGSVTGSNYLVESFSGKKVMVWGETISAQKAGWLMDVGKIKVLD